MKKKTYSIEVHKKEIKLRKNAIKFMRKKFSFNDISGSLVSYYKNDMSDLVKCAYLSLRRRTNRDFRIVDLYRRVSLEKKEIVFFQNISFSLSEGFPYFRTECLEFKKDRRAFFSILFHTYDSDFTINGTDSIKKLKGRTEIPVYSPKVCFHCDYGEKKINIFNQHKIKMCDIFSLKNSL